MRLAICCFPLVGVVVAALQYGWLWLCGALRVPPQVRVAMLTALPLLVTGGIHVDGFMDTCDALASLQPMERRLQILKDPHAGAFAVIGVLLCGGLYAAFASLIPPVEGSLAGNVAAWCLGAVLSRMLSGAAVVAFPAATKKSSLSAFTACGQNSIALCILVFGVIVCSAILPCISPSVGTGVVVASALTFWYYHWMSCRQFGGITGDLAGWFVCVCELVQTAVAGTILWWGSR